MRRAVLALGGIVAGTTLLISLKSAPGASRLPAQVVADEAAVKKAASLASASPGVVPEPTTTNLAAGGLGLGASASAGAGAGAGGSGSGASGSGGSASGTAGGSSVPTTKAAPKPTTKAPAPPNSSGTFTGDSSFTEFGYVTVAITVAGGKITDVTAVEMPSNEPRSVSISKNAAPVLRQRALAAQSSTIDTVSGATYTSEGYRTSLQSAIDKAGLH